MRNVIMRHDPLYFAYDVHCPSPAEATRIQEMVRRDCATDAQMVVSIVSSEESCEKSYRIGDFFSDIFALPGLGGDTRALRLVFHRQPRAGRFWKDIMVRVLRSIENSGPDVAVNMAYKGDDCLDWGLFTPA